MIRHSAGLPRTTCTKTKHNTAVKMKLKRNCPTIIAPSLLSCDLSRIADDARQMADMGADWLHMDIMDGHFVPNLSFGPPVISSLHKAQKDAYLDCHLMVSEPAKWVDPLKRAGAKSLTFHVESNLPAGGAIEMIKIIRDAGMNAGVAVKPGTSIESILPLAESVDMVLVMTVEPGFSGQKFMPDMMTKVKTLRERFPDLNIQVDGGLSPKTVGAAAENGANVIVAASAIFGSDDRQRVINDLRAGVDKYSTNQ